MKDLHELDTVDMPLVGPDTALRPRSARVEVDLAGQSHQGKVRPNNEDHFLAVRFGRAMEALVTNLPDGAVPPLAREVGYAMVVADGVGGSVGGEVASRLAIQTLINLVLDVPDWILRPNGGLIDEVMRRASERYHQINLALAEEARAHPALRDMATTMTMACSLGIDLLTAHIGDSRAYLFGQGQLRQLTRDHTLAQALADRGEITPDQVARNRLRHVLMQSLSAGGREVEPDVEWWQLADGDCLLLCTDGLTEMVDDVKIAGVLESESSADAACRRLIALALDAGGKDNVTVVVARYRVPRAERS